MPVVRIVSASTRAVSAGRPLAHWVHRLAAARPDFAAGLIDLRELGLPLLDEPEHPSTGRYRHRLTRQWSATVEAADAFVFVMPMYNGGFGAPLKNAVDHLYREWRGKAVGLVGYSGGGTGGEPAVEMIRPVLTKLGMRVAEGRVCVPGIGDLTGPDGGFRPGPGLAGQVGALLEEVCALASVPAEVVARPGS